MKELQRRFSLNGHELESELVLLWFSAEWCGPCKQFALVMSVLAGQYGEQVHIEKVDVDEDQALAKEFNIRAVPTLVLVGRTGVVDTSSGYRSLVDLRQWLETHQVFTSIEE